MSSEYEFKIVGSDFTALKETVKFWYFVKNNDGKIVKYDKTNGLQGKCSTLLKHAQDSLGYCEKLSDNIDSIIDDVIKKIEPGKIKSNDIDVEPLIQDFFYAIRDDKRNIGDIINEIKNLKKAPNKTKTKTVKSTLASLLEKKGIKNDFKKAENKVLFLQEKFGFSFDNITPSNENDGIDRLSDKTPDAPSIETEDKTGPSANAIDDKSKSDEELVNTLLDYFYDNVSEFFPKKDFTEWNNEEAFPVKDKEEIVKKCIDEFKKERVSEINALYEFYRSVCKEIENSDNYKDIVARSDMNSSKFRKEDYSIYSEFEGEPHFGNLVGSVSIKFSEENGNLDKLKNMLGRSDSNSPDVSITVTIEIRSRFDKVENMEDNSKVPPYFLLTMLTCVDQLPNDYLVKGNSEDLFDCLLMWRLRQYLIEAAQKGIYHTYHTFEANNDRLKGTIDFARHIKLNVGMKNGCVAYTYREKTADNYLNHLILEAYEYLKKKNDTYRKMIERNLDSDSEAYATLVLLRNSTNYPKYARKYLMKKCESPITHPYYEEYEKLRQVCLAILRDEGLSLFNGTEEEVQGILYYVPDLWEQYLESEIRKIYYAGKRADVEAQKILPIYDKSFKSKPDFIFYEKNAEGEKIPFLMLDAKFKKKWEKAHFGDKYDLSSVIEDYDKCIRDMNSINAFACGAIFPYQKDILPDSDKSDTNKSDIKVHIVSEEYNKKTNFYSIAVPVPMIEKCEEKPEETPQENAEKKTEEKVKDQQNEIEFEDYSSWKNRFDENIKALFYGAQEQSEDEEAPTTENVTEEPKDVKSVADMLEIESAYMRNTLDFYNKVEEINKKLESLKVEFTEEDKKSLEDINDELRGKICNLLQEIKELKKINFTPVMSHKTR